ncbi:MAG TPA: hypothetical protein VGS01_02170 [Candidatus Limnocylindria bacterium]|nr:hypothetical protein [Candidatus Limnocylindria bacterium]
MRGEGGQALVMAAIVIGIGALAVVGLRVVQDRVLANAVAQDAGEAAVEAAAAAVADAYVAHLDGIRRQAFDVPRPTADVRRLLADPATREAARSAAVDAAARNGAVFDGTVDARCVGGTIQVELHHAGRLHRAAVQADACSPR